MHLDDDQRHEYDEAMTEAIGTDRDSKVTREMGERVRQMLLDAEQAQRPWASQMLDDDQLAGCVNRAKRWLDSHQERMLVAFNGQIIAKARRKGRKQRNQADGSSTWQRTLFDDFSWSELEEFLQSAIGRAAAEQVNIASARKLLVLKERAPDTYGPQEASERLGTSIDEVLAA